MERIGETQSKRSLLFNFEHTMGEDVPVSLLAEYFPDLFNLIDKNFRIKSAKLHLNRLNEVYVLLNIDDYAGGDINIRFWGHIEEKSYIEQGMFFDLDTSESLSDVIKRLRGKEIGIEMSGGISIDEDVFSSSSFATLGLRDDYFPSKINGLTGEQRAIKLLELYLSGIFNDPDEGKPKDGEQ